MSRIDVFPLRTSNSAPTLTGSVDYVRIDKTGVPREIIEIEINHNIYRLFDGRLGIDETVTPNIWQLHFDSPLYEGTYDVEARVIDIETKQTIAQDSTNGELVILPIPTATIQKQKDMTILEKVAVVTGLMSSVGKLFGGQNGIGGNPGVHPTLDDDSSTSLAGRSDTERGEDPRVKDKQKRAAATTAPIPPAKHPMNSTDSGASPPEIEAPEADDAKQDLAKTLIQNNPGGTGNAATDVGSPFG